jgi:hypothetical protein
MQVKINDTQQELLKKAEEKGFLTEDDFATAYSSPITIRSNIKRFILLGFLKETDDKNKFEYIKQK